jgi:PAS domain S-box-containing protein
MAAKEPALLNQQAFLQGEGEMAELIRSKNWAATALGLPDSWPAALKQTVNMMLTTTFPVLICWGEDFIQLYNDAFRPINGLTKHPHALGGAARETYAEIWDTIGPMFADVMKGQAVGFPDFLVPLDRNGYLENCYFDFSYSPIRDEQGKIGGILVICIETTAKVVAIQTAAKAQQEIASERDRLHEFFMQAPAGICILDGPELVFELVNPLYQQLFPGRLLLGKPLLDAVPEIKGQPIWDVLQGVYHSGETFEGDELLIPLARRSDGPVEDRYFNFIYQTRKNTEGQVDGILVFVFEVTDIVTTKKELENYQEILQKVNKDLHQTNDQFQLAIASANMGTWSVDLATDQLTVSLTGRKIHGLDSNEQLSLEESMLMVLPEYRERLYEAILAAQEQLTNFEMEYQIQPRDAGPVKWLRSTGKTYQDGNGRAAHITGTIMDITERRLHDQRKDEFLSIASHELKTPLTSIKAYNQLMKRTADPKHIAGFVAKSADHISRLERLINDLLDVTKINAGKVVYAMEPFDFGQMIRDSVESIQHTAKQQIILQSIANAEYTGDHYRLEQVMNNFLSNAVKYSPRADKIIVNSIAEDNHILVSVQDFGIGIAKENLLNLFDRYYRVDNTAMRFEGLGLGLFISSEILKRHKGSFWIESEPGIGSTFFFRLPLYKEKLPPPDRRTKTFFKNEHITIIYHPDHRRMYADWTGFQDLETVKQGCMLMLDYLVANACDRIVNDNTRVQGNWSEAVEWVGNTWFPMMEQGGLKYFAHLFSPSLFSQLSAQKSIDIMAGIITTQYFTDIKAAEAWIDHFPINIIHS